MGKGTKLWLKHRIDLIHDARHLCSFSMIDGYFRGQTSDKICRGGSRGRVQGVRTPPWDNLRFSNTTGILRKKKGFIGVEVEQETSGPPPRKIPGSAPDLPIRVIMIEFVYSIKTRQWFHSHAKCTYRVLARFALLLFATRTLIYCCYCIQKSSYDHFHPYFDIIFFKMKRSTFPVVLNKQTQPQFLLLAIFFTCLPSEKPLDLAFIPSVLEFVQRWRVSWIRSIVELKKKTKNKNSNTLVT